MLAHPFEECGIATGELGFLFNHGEYLVVIHGFGFLFFNDYFFFVFANHIEVIGTLVKVSGTHGSVSVLEFVLRFDFLYYFFVFCDLKFGCLYGVEDFFRKSFGLLLLYALHFFFFGLIVLLVIGSVVDHGLFDLVFGTFFSFLKHGVCEETEEADQEEHDKNNEHRAVVASGRSLAELIGSEVFVLAFENYVNPFF